MAEEPVWQWRVVEGVCTTPGGEGAVVYGVQVTDENGGIHCWADVSAQREDVVRFAARMQAGQPAPCHWEELVTDYITALSMG